MQTIHSLYVFSVPQNTVEAMAMKYICSVPSQRLQQTKGSGVSVQGKFIHLRNCNSPFHVAPY